MLHSFWVLVLISATHPPSVSAKAFRSEARCQSALTVALSSTSSFHRAGDPLPSWFSPRGSMKILTTSITARAWCLRVERP